MQQMVQKGLYLLKDQLQSPLLEHAVRPSHEMVPRRVNKDRTTNTENRKKRKKKETDQLVKQSFSFLPHAQSH